MDRLWCRFASACPTRRGSCGMLGRAAVPSCDARIMVLAPRTCPKLAPRTCEISSGSGQLGLALRAGFRAGRQVDVTQKSGQLSYVTNKTSSSGFRFFTRVGTTVTRFVGKTYPRTLLKIALFWPKSTQNRVLCTKTHFKTYPLVTVVPTRIICHFPEVPVARGQKAKYERPWRGN